MLKLSHWYGGKAQNPKYNRSEMTDTAKTAEPQTTTSLARTSSVLCRSGELPSSVKRVRVMVRIASQMRRLVGRSRTAIAARARDERRLMMFALGSETWLWQLGQVLYY
jgi:hypothetical protein